MARAGGRSEKPAKGIYANYFEVGHTAFEFVIDFGESYAARDPRCHTRIVTSPTYAHALLATLSKAVRDYQQDAGKRGAPRARGKR